MNKILYIVVCSDFRSEGVVLSEGFAFFWDFVLVENNLTRPLYFFRKKGLENKYNFVLIEVRDNTKLYLFSRSFLRKKILKVRVEFWASSTKCEKKFKSRGLYVHLRTEIARIYYLCNSVAADTILSWRSKELDICIFVCGWGGTCRCCRFVGIFCCSCWCYFLVFLCCDWGGCCYCLILLGGGFCILFLFFCIFIVLMRWCVDVCCF